MSITKNKPTLIKIGGSSLSDSGKIAELAKKISDEVKSSGRNVVIVVSAVGKMTDNLLSLASGTTNENISGEDLDSIISMGERISARVFCSALKSEGASAKFVDVDNDIWPIITDGGHGNANILLSKTKESIVEVICPLLNKNSIVVLPGFIGKTKNGKITTLGRGGSDTTAFVVADALDAESVILVSDSCLKSGDPKIIKNPKEIKELDIEDLLGFADSGTKFIHKKSLIYKPERIQVKVIGNKSGCFLGNNKGTVVTGSIKKFFIAGPKKGIDMITITGHLLIQNNKLQLNLNRIVDSERIKLLGLNANSDSMVLYAENASKKQINKIHDGIIDAKGVLGLCVRKGLCALKIKGISLETTEGIIARITGAFHEKGLNIFGIFTITNSIFVFLDEKHIKKAKNTIEKELEI